ncbi:FHA domain-containing protein [Schlesneria sp. T3-172]|uniref:FHA domain-containing protein n=1 Tax=Schlesneria sphaerica TaxID=3373610 RepID=UPI0037CCC25F
MTNVSPQEWRAPIFNHSQVIGRLPNCDIQVPAAFIHVSRQHALVGADKDGLWIQDQNSSGGTQLNGVPLIPDEKTRAVIGDRVTLGGLELYFVSPDASILEDKGDADAEEGQSGRTVRFTARSVRTVGDDRLSVLSPAELEVVRWVCRGLTSFEEIGRQLFRSPHTVRTQLGSVFKKLDVHSREQLLALLRKCEIAWTQPDAAHVNVAPLDTTPTDDVSGRIAEH